MSFLAELRRRNVIRMAGLYLVGAWLVVQVAATLLPVFEAPNWVMRALVVLLAVGLVAALLFSWVFELTPTGLRRDSEVAPGESIAPQTGRRMDRVIFVLMAVALCYFAVDKFVLAPSPLSDASVAPTSPTHPEAAAVTPANPKSIAVLAFANMSADPDNEYFSDGVSEEILNALAKIEGLRIAGRTAAFHFKGRNAPLSEIGATLGVAHVLEGSVRKQGERLRISAQLTRTSDGLQLWAQSFDGTDGDIFALQEQIARKVADALKLALDLGSEGRLVNAGTTNPEAYALYLQASATFNRRDSSRFDEAMAQLDQATTLDPGFARAYARRAALYVVSLNADTVPFDEAIAGAERFALKASELDPTLAEPHAVLGLNFRSQRKHHEARQAFAQALALEPDDVTANFWQALTLLQTGYRRQGIAALDRTMQLDPLLPNALFWRAREHVADGELEQADRLLQRAAESGHSFYGIGQAQLEQARGDREAAIAAMTTGLAYFSKPFPEGASQTFARACFGDVAAKADALVLIDAHLATQPRFVHGVVPFVLVRIGEPERALELAQDGATTNDGLFLGELFSPHMADVRRKPGFPEFLRRTGLASFWDEVGPPDQCRKDGHGDYHCG